MSVNGVAAFIELNPMAIVLLFIAVLTLAILWWLQRTKDNFDLRWVIVDEQTKQPSIHKIGQLTALIMSTWLLVYLALQGRMDGTYFGTYMAIWAGAQVANKYLSTRDDRPQDPNAPSDPTSGGDPKDWTRN
jgi:hypothetical protein